MDCFEAEIIMLKELEGTTSDYETDRLISHMLSCPDCCRHFRFLKSVLTENSREVQEKPQEKIQEKIQERETAFVPENFEVQVMMKIRNINAVTVIKTRVKYR
ncbi:MAG: hypothetical protein LUG24_06720 [Clostridiales bacterium]|nr:hypothetical protein [Clostridiales bacterium]